MRMQKFRNKIYPNFLALLSMFFLLIAPLISNANLDAENDQIDVICSLNGIKIIEFDADANNDHDNQSNPHCVFCNFSYSKAIETKKNINFHIDSESKVFFPSFDNDNYFRHYQLLTFYSQAPPK